MLRGKRVNLRLVQETDLDEFIELWHDVRARGPYYPLGLTPAVVRRSEYLETGYWQDDMGRMVIEDKEGVLVGQILCFKPAGYMNALELAYIILRPESRGKGYMTEAVRLFTDYLFDLHKINRIQLTAVVGNGRKYERASIAVSAISSFACVLILVLAGSVRAPGR